MGAAERRNQILKLLYRRRFETIANLALEMEVSERTVRRDIATLSAVEPIYTRTGRYGGGVYIVDDCYLEGLNLTDKELKTLQVISLYFRLQHRHMSNQYLDTLYQITKKSESLKQKGRYKKNEKL